jgi:hypothetical protein
MASYWIVVPRGNSELFDLLSIAFRGRSGFTVIVDRRSGDDVPHGGERRGHRAEIGPDEIIVAEQAMRVGQQSGPGTGARRVASRSRPLVRGRLRRQGSNVKSRSLAASSS